MAFGWQGERIRLVPVDVDRHLDNYYRWLNDPEITANLLIGSRPITRVWEEEFLRNVGKSDPTSVFFAVETLDGVHIGATGVHEIDLEHRSAITGIFLGDPANWGKGYGADVVRTRARYCFEQLGLETLRSSHLSGNLRSRRMLEKCGYREVGVLPQRYWRNGEWRDEHLFSLTRAEWETTLGPSKPEGPDRR